MPISGGSETGTMRTTTNDRTDYFTLCACIWGNYGGTHLTWISIIYIPRLFSAYCLWQNLPSILKFDSTQAMPNCYAQKFPGENPAIVNIIILLLISMFRYEILAKHKENKSNEA